MNAKKKGFLRKVVLILAILAITVAMPVAQAYATMQVTHRVFITDFENVTMKDANHLNMGIASNFVFQGGGTAWVEGLGRHTAGITCHSGSRCIGMEAGGVGQQRAEFNILNLQNLVGNELFVSVWLYLPADWRLHSPTWNSYEIANPYFTDTTYLPYSAVHIYQNPASNPNAPFSADLLQRYASDNIVDLQTVPNYPLPVGRWLNLQYYVYRDASNGIIKVWIDGALVLNVGGIITKNPTVSAWFTTPAKIYYTKDDVYSPYYIWADDLQISTT